MKSDFERGPFGAWAFRARDQLDMTVEAVAAELGYHPASLRKMESGSVALQLVLDDDRHGRIPIERRSAGHWRHPPLRRLLVGGKGSASAMIAHMSRRVRMNRLAYLGLIALLAACGGVTATPSPTGPTPAPTATPTASPKPTPSPSPSPMAVSEACVGEIGDWRDSLDELDARLDVGLTYADYGDRLGDISVELNRVDIDNLSDFGLACVEAAILMNDAFLKYIDAHETWGDCIQSSSCETSSIEPELQASWRDASDLLEQAEDMFP